MPLYEYRCTSCGHRFERIQKFSDPPVAECPQCGGQVEKLVSSPAIQFKGAGWYVTDYAKSGKSEKSDKADKSGKSDASSKTAAADKSSSSDTASSSDSGKSSDATAGKPAASDSTK